MPVTAKLSRRFYQRVGEDVADALAERLNLVDTSYRQEFEDRFAATFGRLEARMDAIESRVDARLEALRAELLRLMFLS